MAAADEPLLGDCGGRLHPRFYSEEPTAAAASAAGRRPARELRALTDPQLYLRALTGDAQLLERAPERVLSLPASGSNLPALAFTINAVLGAGIVSIPYAFAQTGLAVAAVLLVLVTYVSALGMRWIVEASARADALEAHASGDPPVFEYRTQRGVTELCGFYFGAAGSSAAEVALVFYGVTSMFLYAAVFAETCASVLPVSCGAALPAGGDASRSACDYAAAPLLELPMGCRVAYWFWLAVFAAMQGLFAARNLSEQASMQVALSALGMLALGLMLSTLVIEIFNEDYHDCRGKSGQIKDRVLHTCPVAPIFRPAGLSFAVSTLSSAQMAQFGTPVLTASCADKRGAPGVFERALWCTCGLYVLYGVLGALHFGFAGVQPLVTVLWRGYSLPWGRSLGRGLGNAIGLFIAAYPAVTVSAAFPLNVVATGNALLWSWCDCEVVDTATGKTRVVAGPRSPITWLVRLLPCCWRNLVRSGEVDRLPEGAVLLLSARRMQHTVRALVMLPAFALAARTSDLGVILQVSSLAGFLFAFVVPPALQLASRRRCERELGGAWRTPYSATWGSGRWMCYACLAFGLGALLWCSYSTATGQV